MTGVLLRVRQSIARRPPPQLGYTAQSWKSISTVKSPQIELDPLVITANPNPQGTVVPGDPSPPPPPPLLSLTLNYEGASRGRPVRVIGIGGKIEWLPIRHDRYRPIRTSVNLSHLQSLAAIETWY